MKEIPEKKRKWKNVNYYYTTGLVKMGITLNMQHVV